MIIVFKFLFDKILKKYTGITIFPFIFINKTKEELGEEKYMFLVNHEKIHFRQQLETLFIFFYILYLFYYLYFRLKGFNHFQAYRNIPFEIESYENEKNLNYLNNRKFWNWRKYKSPTSSHL